ncbi:hypothetical protein [Actinoplanes sp. NPDC026670]|uniref:hypothetical protein n=1 Tax=Actinoplanes sp. NPDC026670 TaxID=3154700 RepID=UPI0033D1F9A6
MSANGLNANMGTAPERAHLINRHLAMLQQLTTTGRGPLAGRFTDAVTGRRSTVDFRGHLDMTRVGTLGHSVAGEGVYYQAGGHPPPTEIRTRQTGPGSRTVNRVPRPGSLSTSIVPPWASVS